MVRIFHWISIFLTSPGPLCDFEPVRPQRLFPRLPARLCAFRSPPILVSITFFPHSLSLLFYTNENKSVRVRDSQMFDRDEGPSLTAPPSNNWNIFGFSYSPSLLFFLIPPFHHVLLSSLRKTLEPRDGSRSGRLQASATDLLFNLPLSTPPPLPQKPSHHLGAFHETPFIS